MKKLLSVLLTLGLSTTQAAEITIAYDADPVSLDPMQQLSAGTLQMANMLFDPLVRYDSRLNIVPRLAKSWQQIDDKTLRFFLRPGVKFQSGHPVTADDVVFSFRRATQSPNFKSITAPFTDMLKVDDSTVDLVSKAPYPLTLQMMTNIFIMDKAFYSGTDDQGKPKDLIDASGNTYAAHHVSGSGAFRLTSRQQGIKSVYTKNPDYWGETGNVDTVNLVVIKENNTRLSALLSGAVDWIYPLSPIDVKRVKKNDKMVFYSTPSNRVIFLFLNQNVNQELKDVRVRQAIEYAINNAGIVQKIMANSATAAGQFAPKGFSGHDASLTPRYDLAKAKALMKEAGLEDGFSITMIAPNNRYVNDEKIAQAIAAMLAKINIKVELATLPKAQYFPLMDRCEHGIAMLGISPIANDAIDYSSYDVHTRDLDKGLGQYNCSYSNRELDHLIESAFNEMDKNKRNDIMLAISQMEYEEVPVAMLHWQNLNWAYKKTFKNFPEIVNMSNIPKWDELNVAE